MPIQTSSITTSSDGNLSLDPNGTGDVFLANETGGGEKPLSADTNGKIKQLDSANLDELPQGTTTGDLIVVQRESKQFKLDAAELGSRAASPSPSDVSAFPDFVGGSGTVSDPYIITPVTVSNLGGSAQSIQQISIANQPPSSQGNWEDLSVGTGFRFSQASAQFDAAGQWSGYLTYVDSPASSSGQVYKGAFKMGSDTATFFSWDVTQVALSTNFQPSGSPNASPPSVNYVADNKFGRVSGAYGDAAGALTAVGAARFGVNGSAAGTTGTVGAGDILSIEFDEATVNAAAEGGTVTGSVSGPSGFDVALSMVVNRSPFSFTVPSASNVPSSTAVTSSNIVLTGINCKTGLTYVAASTTLTGITASVNGGAFATVPSFGDGLDLVPGDTLRVRGNTGTSLSTTYSLELKIGTTIATFTATTAAADPAVSQPSITSPVTTSSDLKAPLSLVSTAYNGFNSAGAHGSSDWEVYEAQFGPPQTSIINSVDQTLYADIFATGMDRIAIGEYQGQEYYFKWEGGSSYDRSQSAKDAGQATIFVQFSRSSDGGKTYVELARDFVGKTQCTIIGSTDNPPLPGPILYDPTSERLIVVQYTKYTGGSPSPNPINATRVYFSTDGGITWQSQSSLSPGAFQAGWRQDRAGKYLAFGIDTNNNGNAIKSSDGGVTWQSVGGGVTAGGIPSGSLSPYVGANGWLLLWLPRASNNSQSIRGTKDFGENWTEFGTNFPGLLKDRCIASDNAGNLIMQVDTSNAIIYKSTNSGSSWQEVANPTDPPYPKTATAFCWDDEQKYFTAIDEDGTQFWSSPDGETWTKRPITIGNGTPSAGNNNRFLTNVPNDPRTRLTSFGNNAYYSPANIVQEIGTSSTKLVLQNNLNLEKMSIGDGVSEVGGAGDATGTINGIVTSPASITVIDTTGVWSVGARAKNTSSAELDPPGIPTSSPPDPSLYTQVVGSVDDATNLTSYPLTDTELDPSKAYYSRVRYNSNDGTPVHSDFSPYNDFRTAESFVPDVGDVLGGGFFTGQILDGGTVYNIIVAPKTGNSLEGDYGALDGLSSNNAQWRVTDGNDPSSIDDDDYGATASWNFSGSFGGGASAQYPAFNWVQYDPDGPNAGTVDATNAAGTGISGFNDWYVPAKNEMELVYRNLKPTTTSNSTSDAGTNPASVPVGTQYTTSNPAQTSVSSFRTGGANALITDGDPYLTASQKSDERTTAWFQWVESGGNPAGRQVNSGKTSAGHVRAVRRFAA